jgi:hypothetical protein
MESVLQMLQFVAVLAAAGLLGNWFLTEVRKSRARKAPWYRPYLTVPGIMVVIAVLIPVIYWLYLKLAG